MILGHSVLVCIHPGADSNGHINPIMQVKYFPKRAVQHYNVVTNNPKLIS